MLGTSRTLPRVVTLETTSRCNLSCRHCFGSDLKKEASTERMLDIASRMTELGVKRVIVSGGESLTRQDLPLILEKLAAKASISLLTNGILLPERLDEIRQFIDWIGLSLDGDTPQNNAVMRGSIDHFGKVMDSLGMLMETDIKVRVETLVSMKNQRFVEGVGKLLVNEGLYPDLWKVKQFIPSLRIRKFDSGYLIPYVKFAEVMKRVSAAIGGSRLNYVFTPIGSATWHHMGVMSDGSIVVFGLDIERAGNILNPHLQINYDSIHLNPAKQDAYDREWEY